MKSTIYNMSVKKAGLVVSSGLLILFAGLFNIQANAATMHTIDQDPAHHSKNVMDLDPAHHRNDPSFTDSDPAHNSTNAMDLDPAHHRNNPITTPSKNGTKVFTDTLTPLNNSGVHGYARLVLKGDQLNVKMFASGLEPGKEHAQHIHGKVDKSMSECPAKTADTDMDGTVSLAEGLPSYGPILQSLTPFQSVMTEVYNQTFTVNPNNPETDVLPLENREIVLHGMTVAANQDKSNPAAGYDATLPVACGHINLYR